LVGGSGSGCHELVIKRDFLEASEYLNDDCFKLRCNIFFAKDLRMEYRVAASSFHELPLPLSNMPQHSGDLLLALDVTIHVSGATFRAHRSFGPEWRGQ
ncbi:hypothetical protein BAE44_0000586, partial [Dichanthelium oligosanthes]